MAENSLTSGIAGQIKELFPILTKFVLGLAGAPFPEICQGSEADEAPKQVPQQTAGGTLVVAVLICLSIFIKDGNVDKGPLTTVMTQVLLHFAALSTLAVVLPLNRCFKISKTESVCAVAVYWIPWYALGQATYGIASHLFVPFLMFPAVTASIGLFCLRHPIEEKGVWRYVAGVVMLVALSYVGFLIYGAFPADAPSGP